MSDNLKGLLKNEHQSLDLIGKVENELIALSMNGLNLNEPKNLADGLKEFIEERRNKVIELTGISTGFPILDKQIDGLTPGSLTVLAARKKMGKSAFLSNICLNASCRLSLPVLYVDTELNFDEWRTRALSTVSGVKEREIKHGGYSDEVYKKLLISEEIINKSRTLHEYMPGYSMDKLVALYKKYKIKEDIGMIIFDYLKEPESTSIQGQRKEYQILGDITTKLKDLAGELKIPALTAVQLNRNNDIADSDRIARYADVICFWSLRSKEELDEGGIECGSHKLVIKDSRRGGTTSDKGIGYHFFKESITIKEVAINKQYFANFDKEVVSHDSANRFKRKNDLLV